MQWLVFINKSFIDLFTFCISNHNLHRTEKVVINRIFKDIASYIYLCVSDFMLTLPVPIPDEEKKIKLNFYFHTSLWCLKSFYEGLKGLHKTFWGTAKKCDNKTLTWFLFQYNFQRCTGRERLICLTGVTSDMVIFLGNCSSYETNQLNIFAAMIKRLFLQPHILKKHIMT